VLKSSLLPLLQWLNKAPDYSLVTLFLKLNSSSKATTIEVTNILSLGTTTKATTEATEPIIKGALFCKFLYCSIQSTTNNAVKENSKPAVSKAILLPTIAPRVEPINQ